MTRSETLNAAVKLAQKRGWKLPFFYSNVNIDYWLNHDDKYKALIFNHDFAKAIWGEDRRGSRPDVRPAASFNRMGRIIPRAGFIVNQTIKIHGWQYHLSHMVVAEDPLAYLSDNL